MLKKLNIIDRGIVKKKCRSKAKQDPLILVVMISSIILGIGGIYLGLTKKGRTIVVHVKETVSKTVSRKYVKSGKPFLIGITGPFANSKVEFDKTLTLGRDPGLCNLVFPAEIKGISKRHATIHYDKTSNRFNLEDCWSRNGTFLQTGKQIDPKKGTFKLKPGEKFYLFKREYLFEVNLDPE